MGIIYYKYLHLFIMFAFTGIIDYKYLHLFIMFAIMGIIDYKYLHLFIMFAIMSIIDYKHSWASLILNIHFKAITRACKLINVRSLALCSATVSVDSAGLCHRNKVNLIA